MTRPDTHTAAVALQVFGASKEGGALPVYWQMMAAALVCAAPVVVLYLVFQRYLVGGLTAGRREVTRMWTLSGFGDEI